MITKNTAF